MARIYDFDPFHGQVPESPDDSNSGHKRAKHDFSAYSLKPQIANVTRITVLEAQVHTCPQARTMSETRFSTPHLPFPLYIVGVRG